MQCQPVDHDLRAATARVATTPSVQQQPHARPLQQIPSLTCGVNNSIDCNRCLLYGISLSMEYMVADVFLQCFDIVGLVT